MLICLGNGVGAKELWNKAMHLKKETRRMRPARTQTTMTTICVMDRVFISVAGLVAVGVGAALTGEKRNSEGLAEGRVGTSGRHCMEEASEILSSC
jgi:hypothetical protein